MIFEFDVMPEDGRSLDALKTELMQLDSNTYVCMPRTELDELQRRNENAFRIMRERANAERGIEPKKKHFGYIFRGAEQIELDEKVVWRVRFQMPFPIELDYATVSHLFFNSKKDCDFCQIFMINGYIKDIYPSKFRYSMNMRTGFWEVTLCCIEAPEIPREMFPPKKKRRATSKDTSQ